MEIWEQDANKSAWLWWGLIATSQYGGCDHGGSMCERGGSHGETGNEGESGGRLALLMKFTVPGTSSNPFWGSFPGTYSAHAQCPTFISWTPPHEDWFPTREPSGDTLNSDANHMLYYTRLQSLFVARQGGASLSPWCSEIVIKYFFSVRVA